MTRGRELDIESIEVDLPDADAEDASGEASESVQG